MVYYLSQREWQEIMGSNPSQFKGDSLPVEHVSWNDIQVFIQKLNKVTGQKYCLPSEAQWEYAARGGQNFIYSGSNNPDEVAWYEKNSGKRTYQGGLHKANGYSLYDMSGNVWEWCQDLYNENYYGDCKNKEVIKNPICLEGGVSRVLRGGSWGNSAGRLHCANRFDNSPQYHSNYLGFRLAKF